MKFDIYYEILASSDGAAGGIVLMAETEHERKGRDLGYWLGSIPPKQAELKIVILALSTIRGQRGTKLRFHTKSDYLITIFHKISNKYDLSPAEFVDDVYTARKLFDLFDFSLVNKFSNNWLSRKAFVTADQAMKTKKSTDSFSYGIPKSVRID